LIGCRCPASPDDPTGCEQYFPGRHFLGKQ
jgi:hypothetical protein